MDFLAGLGLTTPIVQAGMGGGLSRHELAVAVSEAGGLGTIAVSGSEAIGRELATARTLTDRPIAVNLLLPFARPSWFEAASAANVVVTFWGTPKRHTGGIAERGDLRRALDAGASAAIAGTRFLLSD